MKKNVGTILYIILGVIPTIIMFATHDIMCKYDMNPLCYLECLSFAILTIPLLYIDKLDE